MTPRDIAGYNMLFLKTAQEHIQVLELLLSSDKFPDAKEIFRHVHSLKGSSQMMGYQKIATICSEIISYIRPEGTIIQTNNEAIEQIKKSLDEVKKQLKQLESEKIGDNVL